MIRQRPYAAEAAAALRAAGLPPLLARLYAARGVSAADELAHGLSDLEAPERLRGIEGAAALLAGALAARSRILVVGDYDCDGATASAVGVLGLRMMGADVDYLVPNRFEYGYGLTPEIVRLALSHPRLPRPQVLVTVDNGIASVEGVAAARAAGLRVLVTDHHLPGDTLPDADAIVNPNQPGCAFTSKSLAGVGVMFYVLLGLRARLRSAGAFAQRPEPPLQELLDLVALGTVADVVRLDRNNRLLVAAGLRRIRAGRARPGIAALLRVAGREQRRASATDLGFALGPRINAAGRLADMSLGIECLLATDASKALEFATRLDEVNRERREIEADMRAQALADVDPGDAAERHGLVLYRPEWHQGVIGLVAARVKERHHRPTIAFAPADAQASAASAASAASFASAAPAAAGEARLKGSGRSIPGVHLRDALDLVSKRLPGAIDRFGGHAMAAGLTLRADALAAFTAAFDRAVEELADAGCFSPCIDVDGELADDELSLSAVDLLDGEIWGQGFPAPAFVGEFDVTGQRLLKDRHLKLELRRGAVRVGAIAFGRREPLPARARLVFRLSRDEWQGRARVSLLIEHVVDDPAPGR